VTHTIFSVGNAPYRASVRPNRARLLALRAACPCSRDGPHPRRPGPHHPLAIRTDEARPCSRRPSLTLHASAARPRAPHALAQTRASYCGRAPFAYRGPCRGLCRRRAPHRRPLRHSMASSSMPVLSSASTSLHFYPSSK
jgi:hypothetical protein